MFALTLPEAVIRGSSCQYACVSGSYLKPLVNALSYELNCLSVSDCFHRHRGNTNGARIALRVGLWPHGCGCAKTLNSSLGLRQNHGRGGGRLSKA